MTSRIDAIGADPFAQTMWEKASGIALEIEEVPCGAANIIKQEAIASGIDAVVARGTVNCAVICTNVIITGSLRGLKILIKRLKRQPFSLALLADDLSKLIEPLQPLLTIKGKNIDMSAPRVMGILNVTPDSFSDGGIYNSIDAVKARIDEIINQGASFIDIGGVSTRPGHSVPSVQEELARVLPAVEAAVKMTSDIEVFVSIDSWRPEVLQKCIELGIDMINDQGFGDSSYKLVAEAGCAYCIMHNDKALPQSDTSDTLVRMINTLSAKAAAAELAGVKSDSIILDPGFGFYKSSQENYSVLHYLSELCNLKYNVLAGLSRKSMLSDVTGREVQDRDYATVAVETAAAMNGARIIRTHNVAACVDAMKIINTLQEN